MKRINVLNKILILLFVLLLFGINIFSNAASITSNEYKLTTKENKNYIIGIYPNTKVQQLKENIKTDNKIKVYNQKEEITDNNTIIKTGNIVKTENKSYIAIVCGDVDGNGKLTLTDLVKIKKHIIGREKLLGEKQIAADIDVDGEATVTDILKLKRVLVKIIDEQSLYENEYKNDEFKYKHNKLTNKITILQLNDNYLNGTLRLPNKIDRNDVVKIEGSLGENNEITEVVIPTNIEEISSIAFSQMQNIQSLKVSELNEQYSSNDGVLYNKEETKLVTYPRGKQAQEYYIGKNVKEIGEYAFYCNDKTKTIYIPENVEKVAENSFDQTAGNIYIKENSKVKSILDNAGIFYNIDQVPVITELTYKIEANKTVTINAQANDAEGIIAWNIQKENSTQNEWKQVNSTKTLKVTHTADFLNETYILKVIDKAGNIVSKKLTINNIDNVKPKVTSIKIINPVSGEYKPGEKITVRVEFSEKIKGAVPTIKFKIRDSIATGIATENNLDGTKNYIDYNYTTNNSSTGKIEIYSYAGGDITDIYGNRATITTLPNTGNQIYIITDNTKPEVTSIKIISPTSGIYSTGQKITIRVQFSEKIKGIPPTLYLKIGESIVKVDKAVNIPNGTNNYIDYTYVLNSSNIGEVRIYNYTDGSITDLYGNKAIITTLPNSGAKIISEDTKQPEVTSIRVISPISGRYGPGQKVTIRVQFSEKIKGIPPILRLKIGNSIVPGGIVKTDLTGNLSYIDYIYTSNDADAGKIDIYSYTGGEITDLYGNEAIIKRLPNTGSVVTIIDNVKPTVKTIEIIKPVNGTYSAGQKITIRVNFNEKIKGIAPKLELKIGNSVGTGLMEVENPTGTQTYIDYTYTVNGEHSGLVDIYNYSEGFLTDLSGNLAIIEVLPNSGNRIFIRKTNSINSFNK